MFLLQEGLLPLRHFLQHRLLQSTRTEYNPARLLTGVVLELLTGSGFGGIVGVRHALEPDHFAAVATLISSERSSLRAAFLGIYWGLGHTLAIVIAGTAFVLLQAEMPVRASSVVDLLVPVMLIALGVRAILQAARSGPEGKTQLQRRTSGAQGHVGVLRPLLVGAIHGLAGSGALTALVLTTLPSSASRFAYVVLFGVGSTLSMAAMSGLLGWPLARLGTHHVVARSIIFVVGFGSAALGVAWGNAALDVF